jgi:hypothetical protein
MERGSKDDGLDLSSIPKNSDIFFMARGANVLSPPSLSNSLFKANCSLRGDALSKFDFLMDTVASRDESIEDLTSHIENEEHRLSSLSNETRALGWKPLICVIYLATTVLQRTYVVVRHCIEIS